MEVEVVLGSILEVTVDAIVNAANSRGVMGGGVAGVIRRAGGAEIEREAVAKGPTPVGKAVITAAGKLSCRAVIHAPTMEQPAMAIPAANVEKATRAALEVAEAAGYQTVAFPGMGTGVGRVPPREAARAMIQAIRQFTHRRLRKIILVDIDAEMVEAWRAELERPVASS